MSKRTKSRTIKTYKYIGKHGAYNIYFVNGKPVIGVDIGYGNVKTHNFIIKNGVESYDSKPPFAKNVVEYDNKYFVIGEGRKPYNMDRTVDEDSFILVLAAIAMELENIGITTTEVILVSGLPLKWFARDKDKFKDYLSRAKHVTYKFNDKVYDITIRDIALYPQGLSGIITDIKDFKGSHMMVDIGNATMNVVRISKGVYSSNDIFTDLLGVNQCVIRIRNEVQAICGSDPDENLIEEFLIYGDAEVSDRVKDVMRLEAKKYTKSIFDKLGEYGYSPDLMKLIILGGGGKVIENFGEYDPQSVKIISDIHATVKGYERIYHQTHKNDKRGAL